jgi:hypothetical protein
MNEQTRVDPWTVEPGRNRASRAGWSGGANSEGEMMYVVAHPNGTSDRPRRHVRAASMLAAVSLMLALLCAAAPRAGAAAPADGWLRVGHFAPGSPATDVYIDGSLISAKLGFEQVTAYARVAPGPHAVALLAAGAAAGSTPMATASPSVTANSAATVAAVSNQNGLSASVYQDDLSAPPAGHAKVRIVHTVGNVPAVDVFVAPAAQTGAAPASIQTASAEPVFAGLPFGSASPYADVPAGSYDVQLRATGSGQVVLSAHSWPVLAGTVASIVVFSGPQGVTLEVLRDAAGAAAMPAGAMKTGAGGMAHHRGHVTIPVTALLILMLVAALLAIWLRRVRPPRTGRAMPANTIGVVGDW